MLGQLVRVSWPWRDEYLGAPIWIDLTTSDLGHAQQFYGAVFGWTFEAAGPEYGGSALWRPRTLLMVGRPQ